METNMPDDLLDQLQLEWPAIFAGPKINELSGGAIVWATIQNMRSRREIPADCFIRSGSKVLVARDKFLGWWGTTLRQA